MISANDEENSGAITSLVASISRNYKSLEEDKRKLFTAELKKFVKLFYYISAVYNNWNEDMERLAIVFSVLYNVLYEREETEKIHAGELVELVEFSTKMAQEDLTIELVAEDQAFDGISTDVAMADKTYSLIDEIIEKFNAHYANAGAEMEEMIDSLFKDEDLRMNVKNSAPSAYEYAASEKLSERIKKLLSDFDVEMSEQRILTEAAIFADKAAIDEEMVRLESHFKSFYEIVESGEPAGRKLDFLLQEMNREINTTGSKANNSEIAHLVVDVKAELEKIREQIQNIE